MKHVDIARRTYYTSEVSGSGQYGVCIKCKLLPTKEGHDGCLGTLPFTMNACCGHDGVSSAYVQFSPRLRVGGRLSIVVQKLLKLIRLVGVGNA